MKRKMTIDDENELKYRQRLYWLEKLGAVIGYGVTIAMILNDGAIWKFRSLVIMYWKSAIPFTIRRVNSYNSTNVNHQLHCRGPPLRRKNLFMYCENFFIDNRPAHRKPVRKSGWAGFYKG